MKDLDFFIADVFTDRPFGGNPLAVFPEAAGLSTGQMQALAAEIGFSETVFVEPPSPAGEPAALARLRIFTPRVELPFAGHPILGTALIWDHLGRLGAGGGVFETGPHWVPVCRDALGYSLQAPVPPLGPVFEDPVWTARLIGLDPEQLVPDAAAQRLGSGPEFLVIPLRDRAALDRARIDPARWPEAESRYRLKALLPFCLEAQEPGSAQVQARMFAPGFGIPEDPATGSAAPALLVYLVRQGLADLDGEGGFRLAIGQGEALGRPSRLRAEARWSAGAFSNVTVAGQGVIQAQGRWRRPQ